MYLMNEINKVHKGDWLNNQLEPKSVQLIIGDPPYFEVKGKFDFVWKSFSHYLEDVEKWAVECKRVLADNGTLIWWGHAKKIAHSQVIFDKHFNLLNNGVWEKTTTQVRKNRPEDQRSFIPVTERFLVYDNGEDKSGLARIDDDPNLYLPIKQFFDDWLEASGFTLKEAVEKIGSSSTHWFGFTLRQKVQFSFPTKEKWDKMEAIFPTRRNYDSLRKEYEELRLEYEELRLEYEELRRPFNLQRPFVFDILSSCQESHITQKYDHDTKKPETLTKALINTCSRKGDLVLIPFAGSGTECAMAARTKRNFIGFDIEQKYVDMANKRCGYIFQTPTFDFE